jgi:hypothetical protein
MDKPVDHVGRRTFRIDAGHPALRARHCIERRPCGAGHGPWQHRLATIAWHERTDGGDTIGYRIGQHAAISASTIAVVVMIGPTAVMVVPSTFAVIAPMTLAVVHHGWRGIFTRRFIDHRRGRSPTKRVDVDADVSVRVQTSMEAHIGTRHPLRVSAPMVQSIGNAQRRLA